MFGKRGGIAKPREVPVSAGFPFRLHAVQLIHLAAMQCRVKIAETQVAGDGIFGDPALHQLDGVHAGLPCDIGIGRVELSADLVEVGRPSLAQVAAVAAGPAGADPPGFQHHRGDSGFSQCQGGGNACQTAADNGDIGRDLPVQLRIGRPAGKLAFIDAVLIHLQWRHLRIMLPQGRLACRSGSR